MSAETDIALMVELEEKIDERIRGALFKVVNGYPMLAPVNDDVIRGAIAGAVKINLLNDTAFLTELTKRIGQRMQNAY